MLTYLPIASAAFDGTSNVDSARLSRMTDTKSANEAKISSAATTTESVARTTFDIMVGTSGRHTTGAAAINMLGSRPRTATAPASRHVTNSPASRASVSRTLWTVLTSTAVPYSHRKCAITADTITSVTSIGLWTWRSVSSDKAALKVAIRTATRAAMNSHCVITAG